MAKIHLLYTDQEGSLCEDPDLLAVGVNGCQVEVADDAWIDLPAGAEVVSLPGRLPLGYQEASGMVEVVEGEPGSATTAVAALLPMGFTRCLLPGYELENETALPLFGYAAVGSTDGRVKVAALKTDAELKWNPAYYNTGDLSRLIAETQEAFPSNRIVWQLAGCAREYHCLTAQNIFYRRWEAGIPVSPQCNADCRGCISLQAAQCCPAPQARIDFVPTVPEVVELAVRHLATAPEAIVSFGQGCEGEPSLQYPLLASAIREIRRQTANGTLNMNSNAGNFEAVQTIVNAGLDSIRVSLFSADAGHYNWYHRPRGYQLADVVNSLKYAADRGLMVALNLLFYPGFTNQARETEALFQLLATTGVGQVQIRNLNIDPEKLTGLLGMEELPTVAEWLARLKKEFPQLRIGNYSIPVR